MARDFFVKLVAQDNDILAVARQRLLFGISGVPNPGFRHEIETGAMNHSGAVLLNVCSKEDGGAENALEGVHQPAVL